MRFQLSQLAELIQKESFQQEIERQNRELIMPFYVIGLLISISVLISRIFVPGTAIKYLSHGLIVYFLLVAFFHKKIQTQTKISSKIMMYLLITPVVWAGVLMGSVLLDPNVQATTFLLFILIFPCFLIDKVSNVMMYVVLNTGLFLWLDGHHATRVVFQVDFVHSMEFMVASLGLVVVVLGIRINNIAHLVSAKERSEHHELTGLKNRFALHGETAGRIGKDYTVMLLDIDDFKFFNDMYGHKLGDGVLRSFSNILVDAFGQEDCYNYGGDEFLVAVPGIDPSEIEKKLEVCRDRMKKMDIGEIRFHPTFSCGCVYGNIKSEKTFLDMIALADMLMYQVKRQGKGDILMRKYTQEAADDASDAIQRGNGSLDPLTNLPNMLYFRRNAEDLLHNVVDPNRESVFAYFNLENFKLYNEEKGFLEGDKLLKYIADMLKDEFPDRLISRFAEDHFAALIYMDEIMERFESIRYRVSDYAGSSSITLNVGIYPYQDGDPIDIACDRARSACDSIHRDSRRFLRIYDEELNQSLKTEKYVLSNFDIAMKNDWIEVYYQPIMRTLSETIFGLEALSRWNDPEKGMLSPADFIVVLEKHKLIGKLDEYMLNKVCQEFYERSEAIGELPVTINLSRLDFEDDNLVEGFTNIVDKHGIDHRDIIVEVTESVFATKPALLHKKMEDLQARGFRVWLDDFGSGYSSLNILQEFPFDLVKLDMQFLEDFERGGKSAIVLQEMVQMITGLGMHTLVEGVETKDQLMFLREIGCENAQGYLMAKPKPLREVMEMIRDGVNIPSEAREEDEYYGKLGTIKLQNAQCNVYPFATKYVVDGMPAAVLELDGEKCRCIKCNRGYLNVLIDAGIAPEGQENAFGSLWEKRPAEDLYQIFRQCPKDGDHAWIRKGREGRFLMTSKVTNLFTNPANGNTSYFVVIQHLTDVSGAEPQDLF